MAAEQREKPEMRLERRVFDAVTNRVGPASIDLNRRIAVIGDPQIAAEFIATARGGHRAELYVLPSSHEAVDLGVAAAIAAVEAGQAEIVYVAIPAVSTTTSEHALRSLVRAAISHYWVKRTDTMSGSNKGWTSLGTLEIHCVWDVPKQRAQLIAKRTFDLLGGALLLILVAPLLLLLTVLVKATSPGPIFFKQRRIGFGGHPFVIWKFRTMSATDDGAVIRQATSRDRRITPIGALLRRTSLDELPQLFNILQGSMSLVGPRPDPIALAELYAKQIDEFPYRYRAKPGLTGLAEIMGVRGEMDRLELMEQRVSYDLEYLRTWSLWLDLKILLKTAIFVLADSRKAY
jgi:putative colanic acid biosynthesis UDP-glucose lipid carrier transferase